MKNLTKKQLIKLCELRLKNENKDFISVNIEDDTFKFFNGVSFIIKSNKWADEIFSIYFDKFYPNEFMYLIELGIKF